MYERNARTEVPSRTRSLGKRAMTICCQTRPTCGSIGAQAPFKKVNAEAAYMERRVNPSCHRTAPSSKGVPFKVSDSSSGHQKFSESIDDHSWIPVKERDKCVNLKGTWGPVGTGMDTYELEERTRRASLAHDQ